MTLIDGVWHRRPYVFARQILNASDLLRIALGYHDLQLVVHVNKVTIHSSGRFKLF